MLQNKYFKQDLYCCIRFNLNSLFVCTEFWTRTHTDFNEITAIIFLQYKPNNNFCIQQCHQNKFKIDTERNDPRINILSASAKISLTENAL